MKASELTEKSHQGKPIIGFTDTETVKLDLDNMNFGRVKYWATKTLKQFRLDGYLILKSSADSYHVIFDKAVTWTCNVGIVAWVCLMTKHRRLTEWLVMQLIKHASTLRISAKKRKPSPRIVYRYGTQDNQIKGFLLFRHQIRDILRRIVIET
jgi:hypothetical protein